jgi:hypothetical protein
VALSVVSILGGPVLGKEAAPPPGEVGAVRPVGPCESTFDDGPQGWTSSDGPHALEVRWGALVVKDVTEDWHWLEAPSRYRGDWRAVSAIHLRIRAADGSSGSHPAVLAIAGPAGEATHALHGRFLRAGEWRTVRVPMDAALWDVSGTWSALLASVTSFRIRLDLDGRTDGMEVNLLDDVRLVVPPASAFADGTDGWRAEGGTLAVEGGALRVTDTDAGWCWVRAPRSFRGDWHGYRELSFRVRPTAGPRLTQSLRVQIEGGGAVAIHAVAADALAPDAWTQVHVPLEPGRWAVGGDWGSLLRDVRDLWIRVDLTSAHASDEVTALDDVALR